MKKSSAGKSWVWAYFAFTFLWSWLFWVPTVLLGLNVHYWTTQVGFGLGGLGPPIFGAFFTYKEGGPKVFRDYLCRIWDWKNLNLFWLVMALVMVPALTEVAGLIDILLGGQGIRMDPQAFHFASGLPVVLMVPVIVIFFLLFGPLPEEMGWRGYALDRLQAIMGPWAGSLLLGFFWGLWHLPLFFMGGSFQNTLSIGSPGFWFFFAEVISVSFLMTWIYNHTGRSILSAVLFHFACNMTGETTIHTNRIELIRVILCLMWIGIVAFWTKDRALGYRPLSDNPDSDQGGEDGKQDFAPNFLTK